MLLKFFLYLLSFFLFFRLMIMMSYEFQKVALLNIHMCFLGNPGCGKTEVARYMAGILYENKILPTKKVIEVDRSGLVSEYFGATAEKTRSVITRAMGGVLFIDEAYALGNNADTGGITDYGREAIDTLVKAMEDHRGEFCVIFAGYRNEMQKMLSVNPGLKSRIQFTLDFPNYTREELKKITMLMLEKRKYTIGEVALSRILDISLDGQHTIAIIGSEIRSDEDIIFQHITLFDFPIWSSNNHRWNRCVNIFMSANIHEV